MTDSIDKWAKKRTWKEKSEEWRTKIKVSQTLNRLQGFVLGETDERGNPINMTPAQVKAASTLLNKAMPDLSQSDITQSQEGPRMSYQELLDRLAGKIGKDQAETMLKALGHDTPTTH